MQALSRRLDKHLVDLAWSLWTELGVAGIVRNHQEFLIVPEELIVLTAAIQQADPRLRDEALDWCSRYHHFISISRLKTIAKTLGPNVCKPFSLFSATLNSISRTNWPLLTTVSPLSCIPSGKSVLPRLEAQALLQLRVRAIFGVGARADVISFFLTQRKPDFSASDVTEIGYTKRNLADVLESFVKANIFSMFTVRNQQRYSFPKRDQMIALLGALPKYAPQWRNMLEVLLTVRACIQSIENKSESTQVVQVRNTLIRLEQMLQRLCLEPPPLQSDFHAYLRSFGDWVLHITESLALGKNLQGFLLE